MRTKVRGRRALLATMAGSLGVGGVAAVGSAETRQTTSTYTLLEDTPLETEAYVVDAEYEGATAFVVGGMHGDEEAGYRAAEELVTTDIDEGRAVILPRANSVAVDRGTRHGLNGDLNRKFPLDEPPETELAQAIWSLVETVEPDAVLDLHTSRGVRGWTDYGVGQTVFHSHDDRATEMATDIAAYVNRTYDVVERYPDGFAVEAVPIDFSPDDPSGLLVEKTDRNLGVDAPSLLAEATQMVPRRVQTAWLHRVGTAVLGELNIIN